MLAQILSNHLHKGSSFGTANGSWQRHLPAVYFPSNMTNLSCCCTGLKVTQCDFVAVNSGITVTKSCLQLNVVNNHINARTACINGTDINQSCIMANLFYKDTASKANSVGVQINGNSAWNVIANNVS